MAIGLCPTCKTGFETVAAGGVDAAGWMMGGGAIGTPADAATGIAGAATGIAGAATGIAGAATGIAGAAAGIAGTATGIAGTATGIAGAATGIAGAATGLAPGMRSRGFGLGVPWSIMRAFGDLVRVFVAAVAITVEGTASEMMPAVGVAVI